MGGFALIFPPSKTFISLPKIIQKSLGFLQNNQTFM